MEMIDQLAEYLSNLSISKVCLTAEEDVIDDELLHNSKKIIISEIVNIYRRDFPKDISDFAPNINDGRVHDIMIKSIKLLKKNQQNYDETIIYLTIVIYYYMSITSEYYVSLKLTQFINQRKAKIITKLLFVLASSEDEQISKIRQLVYNITPTGKKNETNFL